MIKLSKRTHQSSEEKKIIKLMKANLKKDPIAKKFFKKYKLPISIINKAKVYFDDIDVSAKTVNKIIILNRKLLNTDIKTIESYLIHEMVHLNQQITGKTKGHNSAKDYLDKPTEIEAFKAQIQFKEKEDGPKEAEKYVNDLLDYHGLEGDKKKDKKEELMPN